jgi:hypothetical protein
MRGLNKKLARLRIKVAEWRADRAFGNVVVCTHENSVELSEQDLPDENKGPTLGDLLRKGEEAEALRKSRELWKGGDR